MRDFLNGRRIRRHHAQVFHPGEVTEELAQHSLEQSLTTDNAFRTPSVTLLGASASYLPGTGTRVQLTILNATNSRADDIRYYYASRLRGEREGVDGVHAHPVMPRHLRIALEQSF